MSLVNMVLMASTWWASEPITAEMMPAPRMPASQAGRVLVQQPQQHAVGVLNLAQSGESQHAQKNAGQPDRP